ncbi:MAG TPA: alpha/beta fold hydrolase [Intrasporangium sp.]|uniref:esterase/lipase family protein n=1 Tax=Intrasporangium sp. TaxID=1925024 RepID=UPI002D79C3A3|nr:alpha/beta fold hydrolase [Intrasporangium sp.]HET7398233.1 alpha/beta fold hydrolase [Intrasporangium sp.]
MTAAYGAVRLPRRTASAPEPAGRRTGLCSAATDLARALLTPTGLAGAALEATWMGLHLGLYPLGLLGSATDRRQGYRLSHLPPTQRGLAIQDVEAAETPILLVHGMVDNRSIFTVLRRGLVRRGFGRIETMNYSILTGDVRVAAARLGQEVERIVEETGYERIHVIGHSMGGLIARYYVTRLGGDEHVHTLVTLGTPHAGSYLALGWNAGLTRQLRPGSALLRELEQPVAHCGTRFVVYWSDLDQVVIPQRNAALHHDDLNVHNIELHGVGHMSLPVTPAVVRGISHALAHLDSSGATVTPPVAEIPRRRGASLFPEAPSTAASPS